MLPVAPNKWVNYKPSKLPKFWYVIPLKQYLWQRMTSLNFSHLLCGPRQTKRIYEATPYQWLHAMNVKCVHMRRSCWTRSTIIVCSQQPKSSTTRLYLIQKKKAIRYLLALVRVAFWTLGGPAFFYIQLRPGSSSVRPYGWNLVEPVKIWCRLSPRSLSLSRNLVSLPLPCSVAAFLGRTTQLLLSAGRRYWRKHTARACHTAHVRGCGRHRGGDFVPAPRAFF
jgi:hypothetical protein